MSIFPDHVPLTAVEQHEGYSSAVPAFLLVATCYNVIQTVTYLFKGELDISFFV